LRQFLTTLLSSPYLVAGQIAHELFERVGALALAGNFAAKRSWSIAFAQIRKTCG
jgi:hypothetical protein